MLIGKEFTNEELERAAGPLGCHLGCTDNQRNTRPAMVDEIKAFCLKGFTELASIVTEHEFRAAAQQQVEVEPFAPADARDE